MPQTTATLEKSTTLTAFATTTIPTKVTRVAATSTFSYSIAASGTGCGDIKYYNYLQADVVTTEQCLDFCDADRKYFPNTELKIRLC